MWVVGLTLLQRKLGGSGLGENAEPTLIPYLHSRGADWIDDLVLTHTDADHVGDVQKWLSRFK